MLARDRPLRAVTLALFGAVTACRAVLGLTAPTPADAGADASPTTDAGTDGAPVAESGGDAPPVEGGRDAGFVAYWSFSDGFESGDFGHWDLSPAMSGAAPTVVTSGAHSGCCAMHATTGTGGPQYAYVMETWTSPTASPSAPGLTSGTVAVRAWIQTAALDPNTNELSFVQGQENPAYYAAAGLGGTSPPLYWGYDWNVPPGNNTSSSIPAGSAAETSYHCVEFVMNVGSAADGGSLAIFFDGVLQKQTDVQTFVNGGWDSVGVGLWYSMGNAPSDLLVDDVTIGLYADEQPVIHIGCP